jgi:hypothetical protein
MSKFSQFMKQNKKVKENEEYAPTKSMLGSDGSPLRWEFQHLTTKQNDALRDKYMIDVQVTGKPNMYRQKLLTSKYLVNMVVNCTVVPNLYDAELQNSYGVKTPEDLVYAMVDCPGEYADLTAWIQKFNGFDETLEDKVDDAKNS